MGVPTVVAVVTRLARGGPNVRREADRRKGMGSSVVTAANGDLVYYTGTDVIDVSALLTQTGTTGAITGAWTITGGTGRFAGASGAVSLSVTVDFLSGTFSATASGTISY